MPVAGTKINQTFNQIRTNFSQANTIFGVDHYTFNDANSLLRGFSKKVTWFQQTVPPTAGATRGIAYARSNGVNVSRIDPYYIFDTGALGNSMEAPILPFKVFGLIALSTATPGALAVTQSFNVASATLTGGAGTQANPYQITVVFTNRLTNDVAGTAYLYPVLTGYIGPNSATLPHIINSQQTQNSQLTLFVIGNVGASAYVSFGVIQP